MLAIQGCYFRDGATRAVPIMAMGLLLVIQRGPDRTAASDQAAPPAIEMTATEKAILQLTNRERERAGLAALQPNEKLFKAARDHSLNMAKQQKAAHELDGKKPSDRIKDAGYVGELYGENLAYGFRTAEEAIGWWMNSTVHKDNILRKDFTDIGIGMAVGKNNVPYWTQVFGKRAGG